MSGKLYIVPTPIGNLEDITLRALRVLKEVDLILAEDSRQTKKLLDHFQISKKVYSHHKFNEHESSKEMLEWLKQGKQIALVSDGGTPLISDPGFNMVQLCIAHEIPMECLPGATALIPALVLSGFSTDQFCFYGFVPHKKGRQTFIRKMAAEERSLVFYESPHRLIKTLEQMLLEMGADRRISVSREISKLFEETKRGSLKEILDYFKSKPIKGEFVLILEGIGRRKPKEDTEED